MLDRLACLLFGHDSTHAHGSAIVDGTWIVWDYCEQCRRAVNLEDVSHDR